MNQNIINFLENLKSQSEKQKKIAYAKIIGIIKDLDYQITLDTNLSDIKGIGKKTDEKIKNFLNSSSEPNPKQILENKFIQITGIGVVKAKKLCEEVDSFEDLLKNQDSLLNAKQKLGLKYYESDNQRIPRSEMVKHESFISNLIKSFDPNIKFEIVGSFRREKEDSGDIDLILTNDTNVLKNIVELFKSNNYILDTYANGEKKFMGWCILDNIPRRLDILFTDKDEYPFSILYFTGSRNCNKNMRSLAIKMGLRLNEHGLYNKKTKERVEHIFKEEKDIFEYLNLEYKIPKDRL